MNQNPLHVSAKMQEWTSVEQRQKLIQEIEMAISQSGNPTMRSGLEIEEQIFQRARSKEDYFNLIARFILHLKEVTATPNNMGNVAPSQKGIFPQVFNIGSSQQDRDIISGYESQDQTSIQQLQTQSQTQNQILKAQNALPLQQQQIIQQVSSGTSQGIASGKTGSVHNFTGQLVNAGAIQSNTPMSLNVQSSTFSSGQQRIQPNEVAIQSSAQMASNLHLKQLQQRKLQSVQAQRAQSSQLVSGTQIMTQQQLRQPQQQQQQIPSRAISSQSQTSIQTSAATSQNQFLLSAQQQQQQPKQKQQPTATVLPKSQSTPSPQLQQNLQSRQMVSPAASTMQMARSPIMNQVSPCPPSNNPPSIGPPAQSPLGAADEAAYAEKLKELAKYIDPLGSLINKMSKGEEHAAKRNKLLNIYEVFTNKRRVTLAFLSKCEQVVQTLLSVATPAQPSVSSAIPSAKTNTLQTVTDNLIPLASNPGFVSAAGHYINPVLKSISSSTIRHPKPPNKRKRKYANFENQNTASHLPNSVQMEIAHMWSKYAFTLEDCFAENSQLTGLCCKPKIRDAPNAPSIILRIPKTYPKESPEYCLTMTDESRLTRSIKTKFLDKLLNHEVEQFQSITCILEAWEQSIKDSTVL